jgi:D-glycero-D-manno-heptose 1,7-bisphosphate phosphatase
VFPEARELIRAWRRRGRVVGVTNQGGVGLGHMDATDCWAALVETHRQADCGFDVMAACFHTPDTGCSCRKPKPGLVLDAIAHLMGKFDEYYPTDLGLMVGDMTSDETLAENTGYPFMGAVAWRAAAR